MTQFTVLAALTVASSVSIAAAQNAQVRFINAQPSSTGVNVNHGSTVLFSNVPYKQITAYTTLSDSKDQKITVTTQDGKKVESGDEIDPAKKQRYTVLYMPDKEGGQPNVKILDSGDTDTSANTEARIALINASTTVQAADLYVGDKKLQAGVNPGGMNGPEKVDVTPHPGAIRVASGQATSGSVKDIPIRGNTPAPASGKSLTAVVFGPDAAVVVDDMNPLATGSPSASAGSAGMSSTSSAGSMSSAAATSGTQTNMTATTTSVTR